MQTIYLNVIKKNRKYFACKTKSGYKARLIIDDNSKDLQLGEQELLVNDRSKKTKYGTDLIFELAADSKEIESGGIVTLEHFAYNYDLVDECKNLGGKWDSEEKCWIFSDIVEDKVEELDELYNSKLIPIEIIANSYDYDNEPDNISEHTSHVYFLGYPIAKAYGRDSGAVLGDNVSCIQGKIWSGGSMKNWRTYIEAGAVFRLKVPEKLLDIYLHDDGTVGEWLVKKLEKKNKS